MMTTPTKDEDILPVLEGLVKLLKGETA